MSNLKSFAEYSPEELAEVSRRGGLASGLARQERKQLKDELSALLATGDVQERLCTALIDKAMSGDARAFSIIRDTIGEKAAENLNVKEIGGGLEQLRTDCRREIVRFCIDEGVFDGYPSPKYGNLAAVLSDSETVRRDIWDALKA